MYRNLALFSGFILLSLSGFSQQSDTADTLVAADSAGITEDYDELMYMSTVYPVAYEDEAKPDIIPSAPHLPDAKKLTPVSKAIAYDMIYAIADKKGLIYVEADPDQEVKTVHVINPYGFEVLCFPKVLNAHHLIRLDLSSLGPGRYTLILEGRFVEARTISINDKNLVARLH
jgi:hypothetical protein